MAERQITVTQSEGQWVVRARGAIIAETGRALILDEDGYPPVTYFPREDVEMAFLDASDHTSVCPYKGTASYFDLVAKSGTVANAAWSYEDPKPELAAIRGHIAFYPEYAEVEEI